MSAAEEEKLAGALDDFTYDVTGLVCADVGASTGGFTDCLLQTGCTACPTPSMSATGQLAHKLRIDERVIVIERTNARHLESLDEPVDLIVIDASFISLKLLLLPTIQNWLQPSGDIIALIKPQFEAGRDDVGKGGVVRDEAVHKRVIVDILTFAHSLHFSVMQLTTSPITGPAGNVEFSGMAEAVFRGRCRHLDRHLDRHRNHTAIDHTDGSMTPLSHDNTAL